VPIWATTGETDLTLQLELSPGVDGAVRVQLLDLHVL
jgi:hypothetical protein